MSVGLFVLPIVRNNFEIPVIEHKLRKAFCWIGLIARLNNLLRNRNFLSQVYTDSINQDDAIKEKKISCADSQKDSEIFGVFLPL